MKFFAGLSYTCLFLLIFAFAANAATFTVTKVADTNDGTCDADCSLREAVSAAVTAAGDDVIDFASMFDAPQTITISGGEITITSNGSLTINGPGWDKLTIDGNNASRIIFNSTGSVVSISGVTFTRGNGVGAAPANSGGAIANISGTLNISNVVFRNNVTSLSAGAIRNSGSGSVVTIDKCLFDTNRGTTSSGGAIQNFSTSVLTVTNSTFTGNMASGTVGGGAIQANGQVQIANSTFYGNSSTSSGGGIQSNGPLLVLNNVTIVGNTSTSNGGGLHRGTTNVNGFLRNSIIAGNNGAAASPDVTNSTAGLDSLGNNIIGVVGTSTGWEASDLQNVNPLLSPAGFYGGLGNTFVPLAGSPAINAGQNCVVDLSCSANNPPVALTTDQRGAVRPTDTTVDIGAVEVSSAYVAILPSGSIGVPYNFTLVPNNTGFTITLNSGGFGDVVLTNAASVTSLSGTPTSNGVFNGTVQIAGAANSALVNYQLTVGQPASNVSVSGRVITQVGSPVSGAVVTISNMSGIVATARTSSFGYFTLPNIATGQTYTVNVLSKQYQFAPLDLPVSGEITNLEITSTGPNFNSAGMRK